MPKFSRRSLAKLAVGLFAFIPVVKYLTDASPALADGVSPSYTIPGCNGECILASPGPVCWDPNQTGTPTLWIEYVCFDCFEGYRTYSVTSWVDTGAPC
jgi:hypothetical protein